MKRILNIIALLLLLGTVSLNSYAQFIPVPGEREHALVLGGNGDIRFGTIMSGLAALYFTGGSPFQTPVDVMQITNNGNFCFRGMTDAQDTYLHLLRGNITYAKWATTDYNCNFIAVNKIKLITNNNHETASFSANKISFYENVELEKEDITLRFGLNDAKSNGWIGTLSETGCVLGANSRANMYLDKDQCVYVGSTPDEASHYRAELKTKYGLFVKKGVLSEDFAIAPVGSWSDFVFHKDYNLRPLSELKQFIEENKHLPDVPSAKEVAEDGYSQHDVNKALLQKVEELTLYVIELQKQIEALKTGNTVE